MCVDYKKVQILFKYLKQLFKMWLCKDSQKKRPKMTGISSILHTNPLYEIVSCCYKHNLSMTHWDRYPVSFLFSLQYNLVLFGVGCVRNQFPPGFFYFNSTAIVQSTITKSHFIMIIHVSLLFTFKRFN